MNMDILIFILHALFSWIMIGPSLGLITSIYTALWYLFIDRGLLNVILALLARPILVALNVNSKSIVGSFWIELTKAPISAYFGGLILSKLINTNIVIIPFAVGLIMWSLNFNLISGLNKSHPKKVSMFIGVLIGTIIASALIR